MSGSQQCLPTRRGQIINFYQLFLPLCHCDILRHTIKTFSPGASPAHRKRAGVGARRAGNHINAGVITLLIKLQICQIWGINVQKRMIMINLLSPQNGLAPGSQTRLFQPRKLPDSRINVGAGNMRGKRCFFFLSLSQFAINRHSNSHVLV